MGRKSLLAVCALAAALAACGVTEGPSSPSERARAECQAAGDAAAVTDCRTRVLLAALEDARTAQ